MLALVLALAADVVAVAVAAVRATSLARSASYSGFVSNTKSDAAQVVAVVMDGRVTETFAQAVPAALLQVKVERGTTQRIVLVQFDVFSNRPNDERLPKRDD
ncbi:MAG: hypothetical protein V4858_12510 [Pseudomonadota bacterium]